MNSADDGPVRPKQEIRREMRLRRQALTARQRRQAARAAAKHFLTVQPLRPGMHLAVYLAFGAELDTQPLIDLARRRGCFLYVPIVRGARRPLQFVPLAGTLRRHRFGMAEPRFCAHKTRNPRRLDAVAVPLLAFGPNGERIGWGAGFYDQTFAFLRRRGWWRRPRLIGLAYHWQGLPTLRSEAWDVPLTAVATDRGVRRFTARSD